jgi:hypothetical protein
LRVFCIKNTVTFIFISLSMTFSNMDSDVTLLSIIIFFCQSDFMFVTELMRLSHTFVKLICDLIKVKFMLHLKYTLVKLFFWKHTLFYSVCHLSKFVTTESNLHVICFRKYVQYKLECLFWEIVYLTPCPTNEMCSLRVTHLVKYCYKGLNFLLI